MKAITVRHLPPEVREAIERRAQKEGLSLERTVVRLLEEATGHDLDHLAGSWSQAEYDEFMEALGEQRPRNTLS